MNAGGQVRGKPSSLAVNPILILQSKRYTLRSLYDYSFIKTICKRNQNVGKAQRALPNVRPLCTCAGGRALGVPESPLGQVPGADPLHAALQVQQSCDGLLQALLILLILTLLLQLLWKHIGGGDMRRTCAGSF